jgi:hypothetical protein
MDYKNPRVQFRILLKKIIKVIREYWTDFIEGLFPTVTK